MGNSLKADLIINAEYMAKSANDFLNKMKKIMCEGGLSIYRRLTSWLLKFYNYKDSLILAPF